MSKFGNPTRIFSIVCLQNHTWHHWVLEFLCNLPGPASCSCTVNSLILFSCEVLCLFCFSHSWFVISKFRAGWSRRSGRGTRVARKDCSHDANWEAIECGGSRSLWHVPATVFGLPDAGENILKVAALADHVCPFLALFNPDTPQNSLGRTTRHTVATCNFFWH